MKPGFGQGFADETRLEIASHLNGIAGLRWGVGARGPNVGKGLYTLSDRHEIYLFRRLGHGAKDSGELAVRVKESAVSITCHTFWDTTSALIPKNQHLVPTNNCQNKIHGTDIRRNMQCAYGIGVRFRVARFVERLTEAHVSSVTWVNQMINLFWSCQTWSS